MKKVLKIVANVVAWALLIMAFLITLLVFASSRNGKTASLFGITPMAVESDSMSPTFKKGDLIFVKKIDDLYNLKEGDVITFYTIIQGKRVINTHRIVEINEAENSRSFVTRGDNNSINDELPAYASDIIGKWTGKKFNGMGKVLDFLRTKKGFFICILIPMAIFFLYELYKFIVVLIEVKKPKLSEEDEEEIKRKAVEEYLAAKKKEEDSTNEIQDDIENGVDEVVDEIDADVQENVAIAKEVVDTEIKA
ncbi:signal peptidase, endoplasmic reticulum-type [Eubacterium ruminantium]|uniref:Signal peptidase I n=1 Tax=Eubacterium ruminantium TaxID=42322 RepID=A0A1T4NDX4_9FIRM|nr:signal peptidase I [Eubacterium ruminantium]SCW53219.1 signal peptidase, endoplasmic reticulum-type [Eubacterium ruminantium]SDM86164.1 signal peptidase, endoplasmic reticulum-type [Eubacterium ruminantium]SJZ77472.1 signal peptidase, endoplasmic reticulum-type [Eubacterium ruminantium]